MITSSHIKMSLLATLVFGSLEGLAASKPDRLTPEKLQAEIESLRPAKLVWREIPWTYCLLDGMQKSRAEKKPILLWAFINSDPASERC